ncbi:MAG TPA: class I SAM-dependent methyltransferase [Polyangiaceae bacterium]|nr:class I SAM-dependent methyltransferase [Polyangiaceae bacterium]
MPERQYDPDRFKDASRYYTSGRPPYPRLLARRVATLVGLSAEDQVLDLGTGPGFLAIDFAPLAKTVVGVDPSSDMLVEAARNASEAGVTIELMAGSSYDLGPHLGHFKLVTIGRAFHWMDREATLKALDPLIEPGGAVALLRTAQPEVPANAWNAEFRAVIDRHTGDDAAARWREATRDQEAVLLRSAFDHLERVAVFEKRRTPIARFVDRALSFSTAWRGVAGSPEAALPAEIRRVMAPHADAEGLVSEIVEGQALVARRSVDFVAG